MYLRQDSFGASSNLMATTSLTRGDLGGLIRKPTQSGDFNILGERHEKLGMTHAPMNGLNSSQVAAPPSEAGLFNDVIDPGGDTDLFGFNLIAGQTYIFSVYGSGADPVTDTYIALFDNGFGFLQEDDDGGFGINSFISYTATYTGQHILGVAAFLPTDTGQYTVDVVQQPAVDVVGDTFLGAPSLSTDGIAYGFIEDGFSDFYGPFFSEVDTYSITLEAGHWYTIEVSGGADYLYPYPDLAPGELDTVIALYDGDGNLVLSNDDINFAQGDVSSRLSFIAEESGTYFLDVLAYQGYTGGFSIKTTDVNPADYDPLDAINWTNAGNIPIGPNNTVKIYFASAGENFGETADDGVSPMVTFGWNAWEVQQAMLALAEYTKVTGVKYEITNVASEAAFRLLTTSSEQYGAYMYAQDPAFGTQQGVGVFNVDNAGWSFDEQQSLKQGGYDFNTFLHEFGHGHGLSHPHDRGGGSEIMLGVTAAQGSYGLYDLNQAVYTVMSYNFSYETGPNGPTELFIETLDNGWVGTLSAFDIAALQQRYGVNTTYAKGNDTYVLKDVQELGTYYSTIWDTKGKDTIKYDGAKNARIDLTAATLNYSATGGGVVSFVDGILGGFTIAAGVIIENATGGVGDDVLIGNQVSNILKGNGGDDILLGRGGGDSLEGGGGFDTASYSDSATGVTASLDESCGATGDAAGDAYKSIEALEGSRHNDTLEGDKGANTLRGLAGNDKLYGGKGNDSVDGGDGNDQMWGGDGNDTISGGAGDDKAYGEDGKDTIDGGDGNDIIGGGKGADIIAGGLGNDTLSGGADKDTFVFDFDSGSDLITDFAKGDTIDLAALDITWGTLDSNANNKLDDGDAYVSVSGGDTFIDIGAASGGLAGLDIIHVDNTTNMKNDSFVF